MPHLALTLVATSLAAVACFAAERAVPAAGYRGWPVYGGGSEGIRYSALTRIDRTNVARLEAAWTYDTGDSFPGSEMQCNPVIVRGVLYATTPKLRVIALDAATGKLQWSFDPAEGRRATSKNRNRGVTYWENGAERRIFFVYRSTLYSLDAATGKPVTSFGAAGRVDLRQGLGRDPETVSITATSPGIVYQDLLILGSLVPEDLPAAPGDIRAYDARTGRIRWTFHTLPRPGEFGYETWPRDAWKYSGGTNSWAGMSLDEKRGLVFASTGSASFDFYGANRHGDNLFANCLLALKANTGERAWHFQAVKHDVWDRDFPAPPSLVTVRRDGRLIDAVSQTTKSGHVFVFERETGKPLFPIETRAVPASKVDGEQLATTQVLPLGPPPFARQALTEDTLTRRTPEAHKAALETFRKIRSGGQFDPPGFEGTLVFPGFDGGAEWGGTAFDPETGLLYVNSNEMPWILRIVPRPAARPVSGGKELYARHCAGCHRADLRGTPPEFPALAKLGDRYSEGEVASIIRRGAGRMPAFAQTGEAAVRAMARFVYTGKDTEAAEVAVPGMELKYKTDGYNKFLDPDGYPAVEPP